MSGRIAKYASAAGEVAGFLLGGALGAGAAWVTWSALAVNHRMRLPKAIAARRRTFNSPTGGTVSYYLDHRGSGRPLLLIHSVNAAASACEIQPLFDGFRGHRPVYAPDLTGFGFSERLDREYSPELYVASLLEFVEQQITADRGRVDVVALSLSCEFVAIAASRRPELFHSLVFISPTGFDGANARRGSQKILQTVAFPAWSQAFFDLLVSRPSIKYYLKKSFAGPVDPQLAKYDFLTAHQPGARYAPLYFLSMHLFTEGIRAVYDSLRVPVLVIANEDDYVKFDALPEFAADHPDWRVTQISNAKSLPHFENFEDTVQHLVDFWQDTTNYDAGDSKTTTASGGSVIDRL
jgi:pimeloyl-ACP methyl ester carboxylesterase